MKLCIHKITISPYQNNQMTKCQRELHCSITTFSESLINDLLDGILAENIKSGLTKLPSGFLCCLSVTFLGTLMWDHHDVGNKTPFQTRYLEILHS